MNLKIMAKNELEELKKKYVLDEKKLKLFLLPKMRLIKKCNYRN